MPDESRQLADAPPPPQLVAHRGYPLRYPENTLEGLAAAVAAGARYLEFDVQLTADRVPVLLHDDTLVRTGGRPVSILETKAEAALALPVGEPQRFGHAFDRVTVPPLARVVAAMASWPGVTAFVEIKRHSLAAFGIETTVERVLEELAPELARCVVISFEPRAVEAARRRGGGAVGWVLPGYDPERRTLVERLRPEYLFCNHRRLPPEPEPLWTGSWVWVCYEVIDAGLAWRLARRGVTLIETMAVAELQAALRSDAGSAADG